MGIIEFPIRRGGEGVEVKDASFSGVEEGVADIPDVAYGCARDSRASNDDPEDIDALSRASPSAKIAEIDDAGAGSIEKWIAHQGARCRSPDYLPPGV